MCLLGLASGALACGQDTEFEKADKEKEPANEGVKFVWKKHPSLRAGDWLRVDFRARFQLDWTLRDPETKSSGNLFDFTRKRLAVEGEMLKIFEFEVSRELSEVDFPWKDVYGNVRLRRWFQVRGGRFRIPFSQDQLTGPTNLDFIDRSRLADRLAPNRDTGVMAHGSLFSQTLKYQFGYFLNDGDNGTTRDNVRTGEGAWAARVTGQPLAKRSIFDTLTVSAAYVASDVPEGLYSLRGRTQTREDFITAYFVQGYRRRTGVEFSWMPGPFSLKSEFADVREQRLKQSLRAEDLPDLIERAWYVQGTWVVTGQDKEKGLAKGRGLPFRGKRPVGAVELAVRTEVLRFASDTGLARPSRSIRAVNVLQTSDRVWTFGINWYVTQWVKAQANFSREWLEDSFRAPIPGVNLYWNYKFRLQLAL
jgi:phosphate-selective porin OprO/OprP